MSLHAREEMAELVTHVHLDAESASSGCTHHLALLLPTRSATRPFPDRTARQANLTIISMAAEWSGGSTSADRTRNTSPATPRAPMSKRLSSIRKGFANIVRWMPLVWRDRDYHYGPLLEVMRFKLRNMADYHDQHGHGLHKDRYAKQMRICAELCRRLSQDDYSEHFGSIAGRRLGSHEHAEKGRLQDYALDSLLGDRDVKLLANMLRKHLLDWWD